MLSSERGGGESNDRVVRRAGVAVFVVFLLSGVDFASWASRLPAVRDSLGLDPAQVGLVLLVGAIGSLVSLPLSGVVVDRIGARRTVVTFAVLCAIGLLTASLGSALGAIALVVAGLVLFGVGAGVWDAAMNLAGVAVEQRLGRSIMPRFHAGFSVGTMLGAGIGAVAAAVHASVLAHLTIVIVASTVAVAWAVRAFLPGPRPHRAATPAPVDDADGTAPALQDDTAAPVPGGGGAAPVASRPGAFAGWLEPRTLMIGLIVFAAALTEGSANDWVSLSVVDGFGTTHAGGALAFGLFVTAMTAMRLLGTALLDRFGRIPVLRLAAGLAVVGLLLFGLVPSMPIALVGVALWGVGAALGFPVGMSAASDDPARAAARVSVVSTIGYSAFLAGPPLLGLLANQVGYRHALLVIVIPVVAGLAVLRAAAPLRGPGVVDGAAAVPAR
ncbi:MAG TPA: MFS transporter [Cellulomonadaceae bacterium]|nr:MFS transporter [Cellulomonadaceae bacterium]